MNTQEINRHGIPKNEEYLIRECILSLTGQDVTARIVWEKLGKTPILVRGKRPKRQFSNICVTLFKELGWNKVKVQGNEVWRAPSNQIHRCKADSPSRARPSCSTILAEGQTSSEQKLLSSIQALSKKDGSCFASDQYLSNHLGISKHEFTSLLTRMTSEGKIRIDTENEKRRIYPLSQAGFHPPYTHIYGDRDDNLSLSFNNTLSNKIDITDMREGDSEPESGYHSHIPSKFHSNFSETPPGNTYSPEAILITDCKNSGLNLQIPEKLSLTEGELDIAREDLLKMSRGWPSGTVLQIDHLALPVQLKTSWSSTELVEKLFAHWKSSIPNVQLPRRQSADYQRLVSEFSILKDKVGDVALLGFIENLFSPGTKSFHLQHLGKYDYFTKWLPSIWAEYQNTQSRENLIPSIPGKEEQRYTLIEQLLWEHRLSGVIQWNFDLERLASLSGFAAWYVAGEETHRFPPGLGLSSSAVERMVTHKGRRVSLANAMEHERGQWHPEQRVELTDAIQKALDATVRPPFLVRMASDPQRIHQEQSWLSQEMLLPGEDLQTWEKAICTRLGELAELHRIYRIIRDDAAWKDGGLTFGSSINTIGSQRPNYTDSVRYALKSLLDHLASKEAHPIPDHLLQTIEHAVKALGSVGEPPVPGIDRITRSTLTVFVCALAMRQITNESEILELVHNGGLCHPARIVSGLIDLQLSNL